LQKKIVLHVISGLSDGGAEGALYRLILYDNKYNHMVVSLTDGGVYSEKLLKIGITVNLILMPRGRVTLDGLVRLYKVIKISRADIVQTWMYHADLLGGLLAKFAGYDNIIWGIRGPYNKKRTSLSTKITVKLCSIFSYWLPSKIISNSYFAKKAHIAIGYNAKNFTVIDNGYSYTKKSDHNNLKIELAKKYNFKNNIPILAMVARFDPHKDHENLIAALSILADKNIKFTCLLVGTDMVSSNRVLASLIEQYNIGEMVRLIGRYENIFEVMSFIDIHVLSSAAESFPNVLAEAMLVGTPCVSTDVGDAKRIIGNTGWLAPANNPVFLASKIETAISEIKNTINWNIRKQSCVERIENKYSMRSMTSSFDNLWNKLISEKNENVDLDVVSSFGEEWESFSQDSLPADEHESQFNDYFDVFPWDKISENSVGFDAGCGSGRWAIFVAPRVKTLYCVDPSSAIKVAKRNLNNLKNCIFHQLTVSNLPFADGSMDFGYSLGVLHHVPDTEKALRDCVIKLKDGAPFLVYLYYAFDNQPLWYIWLWRLSDLVRRIIWRLPHKVKLLFCGLISAFVYWPLARLAHVIELMGFSIHSWPLSAYRNQSFYFMRTDALDRFGTKLEQRFTKEEIEAMMINSGLINITFSMHAPFYCVVGYKG